jgi:hypothetical protein
MQAAGGVEALLEPPEHHGEDNAERAMEAADRIGKGIGVLPDRGGDPGMGELKQQRATRPQEDRGLPVDTPGHRSRTENACKGTGGGHTHLVQFAL